MSGNYNPAMNAATARGFNNMTSAMATPTNVYKVNNLAPGQENQVRMENYPIQLGSEDPEDRKFKIQQGLVGNQGVVDGVGVAQAGPDYFNYVQRKMEMAEEVQFRDWLIKQMDFSTPEATEYWYNTFPWVKEMKENYITQVSNLQMQKAKINLTGPRTPEDWMLLWNENRGIVKIPEQPVHLLPKSEDYKENDYYKRGMFSPMNAYVPPFNADHKAPDFKFQWDNPNVPGNMKGSMLKMPTRTKQYGYSGLF